MARKDNTALAWAVGLGTVVVAGIGIYFYEKSQPAAPQTSGGGTTATNVANQNATIAGQTMTYQQWAEFAAKVDSASLSDWQTSGVPAASWTQMSPQLQGIMTALGYHQA